MAEPIIYAGRECYVGFIPQTVFGTAGDEATVVAITQVVEPPTVDFDLKVRDQAGKLAGGGRHLDVLDTQVDNKRAAPKISLAGDVYKDCIPEHLYAFFHNVTESATTPFGKTYEWGTTQPAFPDDEGYFVTQCIRYPVDDVSWVIKDCICQELTFSCEPGERLKYSSNWIGCGAVDVAGAPEDAAAWTRRANDFFFYEDLDLFTLDFGAGAQTIYLTGGFSLTLTQTVDLIGQDGSGSFKTYGIHTLGGSFTGHILWDANARSALANYQSDTPVDLRIGWGNATPGTVDGDLDFQAVLKLTNTPTDFSSEVLSVDVEGTIAGRLSDTTEPITVVIADEIDRTW